MIRFTGSGVIAEKPRVGQLGRIFPCTLKEKLYFGSKNECLFDGLDELYRHTKFGEDRTTRAGCRCENMVFVTMFVTGRIAANRQTAGIKFTHRPKIRFFAPQGRLVAPIQVKLCRADGHLGPLGCAKFHLSRCRGWECGPKYQKFPLFGKESPSRGDFRDRFRNFLGAFIRLTILR